MIELIIMIAIIALLMILALSAITNQLMRSRDAQRKRDLNAIKVAFEDYYNDNGEYPPDDVLLECFSDAFKPYLVKIPCDPSNNQPYVYVPYPSSVDRSGGYRVFSALESADQATTQLNCEGGCGLSESMIPTGNALSAGAYNYGVSEGVRVSFKDPPVGGDDQQPTGPLYHCAPTCNSCDPDLHSDCVSLEVCMATCPGAQPEE